MYFSNPWSLLVNCWDVLYKRKHQEYFFSDEKYKEIINHVGF